MKSLANSAGEGVGNSSPVFVKITPFIAETGGSAFVVDDHGSGVSNTVGPLDDLDGLTGV